MPGIGLEMEGAVQQAPQWSRQFMIGMGRRPDGKRPAGKYSVPAGLRKGRLLAGAAPPSFLLSWLAGAFNGIGLAASSRAGARQDNTGRVRCGGRRMRA